MFIACKKEKKLSLLIGFVARKTSLPRSTKTLTVLGSEKKIEKFIPQQQIPVFNHYFHFFPNICDIGEPQEKNLQKAAFKNCLHEGRPKYGTIDSSTLRYLCNTQYIFLFLLRMS